MTLWRHIQSLGALHPDDISLIGFADEKVTTYGQLWEEVLFTQSVLNSFATERVVAIVPNCKEAAVLYLACMISRIDLCILGDSFAEEELNKVLVTFSPDMLVATSPDSITVGQDSINHIKMMPMEELIGSSQQFNPVDLDDNFRFGYGRQIVATSGSTGEPKMLALSASALWKSAQAFSHLYKLNSQNTFWNFLPMSYLGGTFNLLMIPLASGGKVLIDKTFGAETFLRFFPTVNRFEVNTLWLIPTVLRGLRRLIGDRATTVLSAPQKISFIGTAPSLPEERRWLESVLGCQVYENYGLTETTFLLAEPLRPSGLDVAYGMQTFPGVQVERPQTTKTLRVKTPYLFEGYVRGGELEREIGSEEWFDTKDLIEIGDRHYSFKGRDREIVKKGGLLINLVEIENLMRPLVNWGDVAAIAIEDDFYGEGYILLYESANSNLDEPSIIALLSRHISKTKMPSDIRGVPQLPKTRSGKVDKRKALSEFRGHLSPGKRPGEK